MNFDQQGWERFSNLGKSEFETCDFKKELINLCGGHEDIAWVVYHHCGERSLKWMNSKIPALGKRKPKDCIKGGVVSLKQVLWSFPC